MAGRTAGARVAREPAPAASPKAESNHPGSVLDAWDTPLSAACLEVLYREGPLAVSDVHVRVEKLRGRLCHRDNVAKRLRELCARGLLTRVPQEWGQRYVWIYDLAPDTRDVAACGKDAHAGHCSQYTHRYRVRGASRATSHVGGASDAQGAHS